MKKVIIFLVCLGVGFWGFYGYQQYQKHQSIQQAQQQAEQKKQQAEELKRKTQELAKKERIRKRKLKALCEDMANRLTLEMMQKTCPNTGRRSTHKLLHHTFNSETKKLVVDIYSNWLGKNSIIADEALHEVTTRITMFGNDKFIEIRDQNEVFAQSKQNQDLQNLAQNSLNIGLEVLNTINETFK